MPDRLTLVSKCGPCDMIISGQQVKVEASRTDHNESQRQVGNGDVCQCADVVPLLYGCLVVDNIGDG